LFALLSGGLAGSSLGLMCIPSAEELEVGPQADHPTQWIDYTTEIAVASFAVDMACHITSDMG
jgi:hypothetical protein